MRIRAASGSDEAQMASLRDGLRAAIYVELAVRPIDVGLDGARGDEKLFGDLLVGRAGNYEPEDFILPGA